ncbi:1-acyl-sn-glycerol-3-phosphate acyltransferase [Parafrankia irregularis]|uniref:1-acyl-sn-glycerol-3-phosphate acyltransferase n=1 Tax=Parafrankia irregularis TaxID=795642 RepID=A0A0S4QY55_9ACTN|nr:MULTISPECIES: lysophospholipid acyltransferase family protein [Parafrankia]MBE3201919.1 1-acyl-sn-glycerol-3-phosphate acyltransferase [Parafrankia sp. CH37]CUU59494.1 1-acyl-sn-glycerol-3-phosphate acyltransferase [Parafrankia irregularis]
MTSPDAVTSPDAPASSAGPAGQSGAPAVDAAAVDTKGAGAVDTVSVAEEAAEAPAAQVALARPAELAAQPTASSSGTSPAAASPAAASPAATAAASTAASRAGARGTAPAHRGAASKPFNDITHRVLKPPVRWVLNHLVMSVTHEGWENIPRDEPLIFAGNHSSWMDGPLVVIEAPRTVRCLVKSEMYKGIVGWWLTFVGQIPVDRGRPDRAALHTALDELSRGGAIGVFPEGTRGSGEMAAVQHGIAYLAVHGRCRVLPVACINTGDALPKGARWPRRSVKCRVVFGEPFAVEVPANPRSRRALAAVAEDIRVRLADHLTTVRAGASGESAAAE